MTGQEDRYRDIEVDVLDDAGVRPDPRTRTLRSEHLPHQPRRAAMATMADFVAGDCHTPLASCVTTLPRAGCRDRAIWSGWTE